MTFRVNYVPIPLKKFETDSGQLKQLINNKKSFVSNTFLTLHVHSAHRMHIQYNIDIRIWGNISD